MASKLDSRSKGDAKEEANEGVQSKEESHDEGVVQNGDSSGASKENGVKRTLKDPMNVSTWGYYDTIEQVRSPEASCCSSHSHFAAAGRWTN